MKMVFLFQEEVLDEFQRDGTFEAVELPEFYSWRYGPFSAKLLDDLEFLVNRGYILSSPGNEPSPEELEEYAFWLDDLDSVATGEYIQESFSLTEDKGIPKAEVFWRDLSSNQQSILSTFKTELIRASLDRILEYVYKKYAEKGYTDKSLIRERYLT